jgi:hypothetical protein
VEGKKESLFTVKDGQYFCPLCGAEIYWACSGDTGWAHCAKLVRGILIILQYKIFVVGAVEQEED